MLHFNVINRSEGIQTSQSKMFFISIRVKSQAFRYLIKTSLGIKQNKVNEIVKNI